MNRGTLCGLAIKIDLAANRVDFNSTFTAPDRKQTDKSEHGLNHQEAIGQPRF